MNIAFVEIKNFRKLESCKIDLSPKSTIFVGANNSGKTSAMFALVKFLKKRQLVLEDFTLSNFATICQLGIRYTDDSNPITPQIGDWKNICPFIDIWINVREDELRYVADIIPTLSWRSGLIGIRLIYEPKDTEKLFQDYVKAYNIARSRSEKTKLWPLDLTDFLHKKMKNYFVMNAYILDTAKIKPVSADGIASPQDTPYNNSPLDFDPFKKLIRIDIISAQRWLEDSNENDGETNSENNLLSAQLRDYYDRQLDPEHKPSASDIRALNELQAAKDVFDKQISKRFQGAMDELSKFGYPGKYNPGIVIEANTQTSDIISHSTVVKYPIFSDGTNKYKLPEKFNGLGYQNLISMSFKLMSFRDSWINGDRRKADDEEIEAIQPIHLVLIEEPEAHLHVQVQQVFIKNAYNILRNNTMLKNKPNFCTQMIVSTHSSNIALECEFANLRYFRRTKSPDGLPISVVINLSNVFGISNQTTRFVARYLRTTHCDLFFADAAILIEGAGERIFMPYFIKKYEMLNDAYISVLEIGGRYAHYLKPLIDILGISCLVITDLDSAHGRHQASIMPERGKGYFSSNPTIQNWIIKNTDLDYLLDLGSDNKIEVNANITDAKTRIAYQTPIQVSFSDGSKHEFIPTTFEDSLAYTNFKSFKSMNGTGLIKKIKSAFISEDATNIPKYVYEALRNKEVDKAEFALNIIYNKDPQNIETPLYIAEGLEWLQKEVSAKDNNDFLSKENE
ncbi:MAG: AAA family ATPase [Oscillospiraceae bacterium]